MFTRRQRRDNWNRPRGIVAAALALHSAYVLVAAAACWLDHVDPGVHRRIKGLRLVTAYGIAAMLGATADLTYTLSNRAVVSSLAGGFALWASVSESRATRAKSSRDLLLLTTAAALGAVSFIFLARWLRAFGYAGPELVLVSGAFLVGYLRRFGPTGTGLGSQVYIGQLLAYGDHLESNDLPTVVLAGLIAMLASIVPRVLSGPAEHPTPVPATLSLSAGFLKPELAMGLQGAAAALIIVAINAAFRLTESAWAITASTYVIAGSISSTFERVKRRLVGTTVGVPLGLACMPVADMPIALWGAAAFAMVLYAMALPNRYDVACGAFAFTLVVTLAANGEHSVALLASRLWETLLGGVLGATAAMFLFPLRPMQTSDPGQRSTSPE